MKKLIILCLSMYLVSCVTSPENSVEDVGATTLEDAPVIKSEAKPALAQVVAEEKEESKPAPVAPPVAMLMYNNLNESIKSQNNAAIQKSASEILMQNPKDVRGLNALAVVNYKNGRLEAAQYLLNKAILLNSASSELNGNMGLVQLAKGDKKEAVKYFRKAIQLNSKDSISGANLGSVYIEEKDYSKALFALEIPINNGLKDSKILNNYAIALAATGKTKEAADIYEKILKDNSNQREVMLNYAILLIDNMQKNKEGLDLLNRLKFVGAPADSRDTIKNLENKAKAGLQ
ncbi:MAG: tetratricopeptide repeat protein [Pseudobdellovibrio sp.]